MTDTGTTAHSGAGMDKQIERPKGRLGKREKRIAIGVGAVLALLVLWWMIPSANSLSVDADAIQTGKVVRAPFQDYVPLRAEVVPLHTTFVAAISGGQVGTVIAVDGAMVRKGQPLATLANPDLELEVATKSADIAGQLGNISGQRLTIQRNRLDTSQ